MRRVFVDPEAPQRDTLQEAAKWIRTGGLVALPTDTLYGLAADPFCARAIRRVFAVKGRGSDRALPLIAADLAQVMRDLGPLTALGARLAARFWPGPLTLIVPASSAIAADVTGGTGRVGVRVPDSPAGYGDQRQPERTAGNARSRRGGAHAWRRRGSAD